MPRLVAVKTFIIGVALLLAGCSAVRLGYNNGPSLTLWWLDGWLDLNRSQEARARPLVEDWFGWHRSTQLPDYAQWVATWKQRAGGPVTGDEICRWTEVARERVAIAMDRAVPPAAELLPLLEPAQWAHLERRMAERIKEMREEFAQPDPKERAAAALERALDRSGQFYGRLTEPQKKMLAEGIAQQAMAPEEWLASREARQAELLQSLKRAQQEPDAVRRAAALRIALQRWTRPGDERSQRWQAQGCELTARLHNSTTPAQRQHLRERLGAWEEDLRALAAAAAP